MELPSKTSPPPYDAPQNAGGFTASPPQVQAFPGPPPPGATVSPAMIVPGSVITVVSTPPLGALPQTMICRSCHAQISTEIKLKNTTKTHLFALALCLLGCWCCVCIPYCMDSCKNIDHYCPNCQAYIGSYSERL